MSPIISPENSIKVFLKVGSPGHITANVQSPPTLTPQAYWCYWLCLCLSQVTSADKDPSGPELNHKEGSASTVCLRGVLPSACTELTRWISTLQGFWRHDSQPPWQKTRK
ncbi:unnamed protein product [Arctogadus glacialis]